MLCFRIHVFLVLIIDGIDLVAGVRLIVAACLSLVLTTDIGNITVNKLGKDALLHRHAGIEAVLCQVNHMLL